MLTFTSLSSVSRSAAMRSSTGATAWHGPHHSAQKSTRTGFSLWRTSSSKVEVVTSRAIASFRFGGGEVSQFPQRRRPKTPYLESRHVRTAAGQARSRRARARDPGALGARDDLCEAARAERERAAVQLRRRPR